MKPNNYFTKYFQLHLSGHCSKVSLIVHSPPHSIALAPITQKDKAIVPQVQVKHLHMIQIWQGTYITQFKSVKITFLFLCLLFFSFSLFQN